MQSHPLVGDASLTVTRIEGGIADNVVPDNCEIVLDRRLLPGETLDAALDDLRALLTRAKRDHGVEAELTAIRTWPGRPKPLSMIHSCATRSPRLAHTA